jgi:hypothetical protein
MFNRTYTQYFPDQHNVFVHAKRSGGVKMVLGADSVVSLITNMLQYSSLQKHTNTGG